MLLKQAIETFERVLPNTDQGFAQLVEAIKLVLPMLREAVQDEARRTAAPHCDKCGGPCRAGVPHRRSPPAATLPLSNTEIEELLGATLHGPLPQPMVYRLMATAAETVDLRKGARAAIGADRAGLATSVASIKFHCTRGGNPAGSVEQFRKIVINLLAGKYDE